MWTLVSRYISGCCLFLFMVPMINAQDQISTHSPYIGQEHRNLKSLSSEDVAQLLQGQGMGMAKAAELNHFPGPRHVLDLADQLQLTQKQIAESRKIFEKMRSQAIATGKNLLQHEWQLEQLFQRGGNVKEASLQKVLQDIANSRAKLRFIHLAAHLQQVKILSKGQVEHYDQLRGYQLSSMQSGDSHNHHH